MVMSAMDLLPGILGAQERKENRERTPCDRKPPPPPKKKPPKNHSVPSYSTRTIPPAPCLLLLFIFPNYGDRNLSINLFQAYL